MRSKARRGAAALAALMAIGLGLTACSGAPAASVALPTQVDAELPGETVDQLRGAVDQAVQASGATGAIVGVWVPWSGTWVAGVGTTEPEGAGTEVTTDMSFRIADVTRAMTCDVLYELADEGTVDLGDSITEHVPSVPNLADDPGDITLQQLCDGTSGLGESWSTAAGAVYTTPAREWHPRELAAYGLAQDRQAPGMTYRDSDVAYLMLGQALENASGHGAAALFDEYVFGPGGLQQTTLPGDAAAVPSTTSSYLPGYVSFQADRDAGCVAPTDFSELSASVGFTDSGVVSTIGDLGRYGQILAANSVAEKDNGRFDHNLPVNPDSDTWFQYGGGAFQAGTLLGQQGSIPGYAASVWADPVTGMSVAVVLNNSASGGGIAGLLGRELAAIASKAPAASGQTQPEFGLPWTAESMHQAIADSAICPIG
ncbi:serine hydrolase [Microbacterium sp. Marseille-Q6965]|uniref:serine hydrolase domain-containing protein n=1 Tax=Microbacterium sp. Marseille-Q6965 TaxID=2965072 RepID=UPI0021B71B21|nr:serine hydrolase domain-containing protein [Microbacterium sp. Marseille-Q6965]